MLCDPSIITAPFSPCFLLATLCRLGVPDSRIVLMLADCSSCDPRTPKPGQLFADPGGAANIHAAAAQVDYRNRDVSVESLLQVLTGHHPPGTPASRRLDSGRNSSVLLYLTGHGGDGFLKFHDQNELLASDLAAAVGQMHAAGRYRQLLVMLDTCQAATMYSEISAPGWIGVASSKLAQSSYALHSDPGVGAHLVDEFSHHLTGFLSSLPGQGARASLEDMLRHVAAQRMRSEMDVDASHFSRPLSEVRVTEFFGSELPSQEPSGEQLRGGVGGIVEAAARQEDGGREAPGGAAAAACGAGSETLRDALMNAWPQS